MSINKINEVLTAETTREINAVIEALFHTIYRNGEVANALSKLSHGPKNINIIRHLVDYFVLGAAQYSQETFRYTGEKYQRILEDARKQRRSLIADKVADKASRIAKSLDDETNKPDENITVTGKNLSMSTDLPYKSKPCQTP
jgi:hypothetical protein